VAQNTARANADSQQVTAAYDALSPANQSKALSAWAVEEAVNSSFPVAILFATSSVLMVNCQGCYSVPYVPAGPVGVQVNAAGARISGTLPSLSIQNQTSSIGTISSTDCWMMNSWKQFTRLRLSFYPCGSQSSQSSQTLTLSMTRSSVYAYGQSSPATRPDTVWTVSSRPYYDTEVFKQIAEWEIQTIPNSPTGDEVSLQPAGDQLDSLSLCLDCIWNVEFNGTAYPIVAGKSSAAVSRLRIVPLQLGSNGQYEAILPPKVTGSTYTQATYANLITQTTTTNPVVATLLTSRGTARNAQSSGTWNELINMPSFALPTVA